MIITISIIRDCPWSSWGSSLSRRVKIELNSCSEGGVFKEVEQCPSTLALLDTRLVDWTRKSNVIFLLWTVFSHVLTTRKITGYHDTRFCLNQYIYIITWYMIVGSLWHRDHVWLYNVIYNKCIYNDLLKEKAIFIYIYMYRTHKLWPLIKSATVFWVFAHQNGVAYWWFKTSSCHILIVCRRIADTIRLNNYQYRFQHICSAICQLYHQ